MTERVTITVDEQVAVVSLNRPDKHNAVDLDMFAALADAGRELAGNASVRAIVLQGAGRSFCAGIDLSVFQQGGNAIGAEKMAAGEDSPANFFQRAAYVWREVPVPVIAALHGSVYGAGLQIALGADLRYAAPDCRLAIMEIKWGIIPDMGISVTLPRILAADRIKELAWSGRVLNGAEAAELGLVSAIHADPGAAALEQAKAIARQSPTAIRAIKQLFDTATELAPASALELEAQLQMTLLGDADQAEAVLANLEKREPRFKDPKG